MESARSRRKVAASAALAKFNASAEDGSKEGSHARGKPSASVTYTSAVYEARMHGVISLRDDQKGDDSRYYGRSHARDVSTADDCGESSTRLLHVEIVCRYSEMEDRTVDSSRGALAPLRLKQEICYAYSLSRDGHPAVLLKDGAVEFKGREKAVINQVAVAWEPGQMYLAARGWSVAGNDGTPGDGPQELLHERLDSHSQFHGFRSLTVHAGVEVASHEGGFRLTQKPASRVVAPVRLAQSRQSGAAQKDSEVEAGDQAEGADSPAAVAVPSADPSLAVSDLPSVTVRWGFDVAPVQEALYRGFVENAAAREGRRLRILERMEHEREEERKEAEKLAKAAAELGGTAAAAKVAPSAKRRSREEIQSGLVTNLKTLPHDRKVLEKYVLDLHTEVSRRARAPVRLPARPSHVRARASMRAEPRHGVCVR